MKNLEKNTILVVSKDKKLYEEISSLPLSDFDYVFSNCISDALEKIAFSAPKIIITSLSLNNDEDGYQLCNVIRKSVKTKFIPIILVSDNNNFDDRIKSIQEGADAFISRPFKNEELVAHIQSKINQFNEFYLLSITDELTRLYNRREFIKRFDNEISIKPNEIISISIIDLDFFKKVNDIYGHQMGDLVLMRLGEILKKYSSPSFFPTRFGGEEFVIMMKGKSSSEAKDILDEIRESFHSSSFSTFNNKTFHISFTGGVSEYPTFGKNLSLLFSRADQALYAAKKEGKNRIYVFNPIMARNDQFWEYLKKKSYFFIDKKGNDSITNLPFLPNVLESFTCLDFEIKSIGIITYSISSFLNLQKILGSSVCDMMIENLKIMIKKTSSNHYATDTYICISDILKYDFIILFPSIINISINMEKCNSLFYEITEDLYSKLEKMPFSLYYSNSVIIPNKDNMRSIISEIQLVRDSKRPFFDKNKNIQSALIQIEDSLIRDKFLISNYFNIDFFYNIKNLNKEIQYLSFNRKAPSFTSGHLLLEEIIKTPKHLLSFLEQLYIMTEKNSLPVLLHWIKNIEFNDFLSLVIGIFKNKEVYVAINENYIVNKDILLDLEKIENLPKNIHLSISNCFISSEILNTLSISKSRFFSVLH